MNTSPPAQSAGVARRLRTVAAATVVAFLLVVSGALWVAAGGADDLAVSVLVIVAFAVAVAGGALGVAIALAARDLDRWHAAVAALVADPDADRGLGSLPSDLAAGLGTVRALARRAAELERTLDETVTTDPVTNTPGERELRSRVASELDRARRHGSRCAVLAIEVVDLAETVARVGAVAGDDLLAAVARLLVGEARPSDVVGRLGDGFAVLLPHADEAGAQAAAARFLGAVRSTPVSSPETGPLTMSLRVGVAVFPGDALEDHDLLLAAREGMLAADADRPVVRARA
ncbi:MAG: GGDEF domain-containing protein [Actinomycetes bacterium]